MFYWLANMLARELELMLLLTDSLNGSLNVATTSLVICAERGCEMHQDRLLVCEIHVQ